MVLGRVSCAVVSDRNTHQGVEYYKEHQLFFAESSIKEVWPGLKYALGIYFKEDYARSKFLLFNLI